MRGHPMTPQRPQNGASDLMTAQEVREYLHVGTKEMG